MVKTCSGTTQQTDAVHGGNVSLPMYPLMKLFIAKFLSISIERSTFIFAGVGAAFIQSKNGLS